ncbi:MAG: endonuclease/exonuclease/phosphatase family protein [Anaerolineae bacterium]|nr:endonuclease/exonuclease/phosphatase family protein [Anaerolineae bacterium]
MPPAITDRPPAAIAAELEDLRADLDNNLPAKALDRNLLIATWNLRAFGDLTEKWQAAEDDSPKRDLHSLRCIADIVARFDVIAIQEARANLKCLRHMIKYLGPNWGMLLTDVTKGAPGNGERLAFLFDRRKVNLSGLASELVVPEEQRERGVAEHALEDQFARTPYAVSFLSAGKTFILVTLHVLYGDRPADRLPELHTIANWMADWARDINAWDHNLIALGDFNIDRFEDEAYQAFISTGLTIPPELHQVPRTLFSDPDRPNLAKFYDQIAWFADRRGLPALSLDYVRGGYYDFSRVALRSRNLTRDQLSWRISDHYPIWTEFSVRD